MPDILDLRQLADEWNDELIDLAVGRGPDGMEGPSYGEMAERVGKYEDLCGELGCEPTPDGLQNWANSYDPTLIAESYFEDYARDLAEDIGAIASNAPWPTYCIDWGRAARDLQTDYSSVEFDGETYYHRS